MRDLLAESPGLVPRSAKRLRQQRSVGWQERQEQEGQAVVRGKRNSRPRSAWAAGGIGGFARRDARQPGSGRSEDLGFMHGTEFASLYYR